MSLMPVVFGKELLNAAKINPDIVALSADVCTSTGLSFLANEFPDRYFEMGICEQNMIGVAAGMALEGHIPFTATYAVFSPGRTWEQIRASVCYQNANVKIIGAHIGFSAAKDGATHQAFEDIALMRCLPNIRIFSPIDEQECKQAVHEAVSFNGPVYIRLSKLETPVIDWKERSKDLKKISTIKDGKDIAIISTGAITEKAQKAILQQKTGIDVALFGCSCLAPIDKKGILKIVNDFKTIITLEEHQIIGGLGSAVSEIMAEAGSGTKLIRMGMKGLFSASGEINDLYQKFELDVPAIEKQIEKAAFVATLPSL